MATTLTLDVIQYFPAGTTLGAYLFYSEDPDGIAPPVAATTTAVVAADGTVAFSGLAAGTKYWVGTGSAPYRFVGASTTPAATGSGGSGGAILAESYGVRADGRSVTDAAITSGTAALSSTAAAFTGADIGKLVVVRGAGASSTGTLSGTLTGTVTAIPVNALAAAIPAGPVAVTTGLFSQTFVTTGAAASATSIPVTSQAVTGSYSSGATVYSPVAHLYTSILSVAAGVATLADNASTTVTAAEATFGTDDTTAAQATVTAALAADGTAVFPSGQICTSAPITTTATGTCTIRGQGAFALFGPSSGSVNAYNTPSVAPYLRGTVFVVMTANVDAFQLLGVGVSQNLRDFGVRFAGPFASTGHGINGTPATTDDGLYSSRWEDVKVYGHDGDHYGFVRTTQLLCTSSGLQSFGGGGQKIVNAFSGLVSGNLVDTHPYHYVGVYGSARGISLSATAGTLNLLTFVRPQVWIRKNEPVLIGVCPPVAAQSPLMSATDTTVQNCCFISPDFEASVAGGTPSCTFPVLGTQILGGGHAITFGGSNNLYGTINSGTSYQNVSGSTQQGTVTFTMNPTGSAAATVDLWMSATSPGTGGTKIAPLSVPISGPVGGTQTATFRIPPGWWFEYVAVNATVTWSAFVRVPGS